MDVRLVPRIAEPVRRREADILTHGRGGSLASRGMLRVVATNGTDGIDLRSRARVLPRRGRLRVKAGAEEVALR